ncbi:Sodium/potassium-transporting ATPase subunit beta-2 [Orchesella cincta]|uniref:Sodium/potassium-transporting ATPase subunit beta-2 n=1 Tax=Orchesella cincta TaxID=48709 RepID=A0A1D2MXV9_ORCCI|nr:Sodium/potassium-transporting ATPase subunit beta-2 [Orchesella cincta]
MAGKKSDKYNPNGGGGFGTFLYNSDTGQVLGRTCGSWLKITVFYIIFYACLSAFFYLCYQIFATTLQRPEENGSPKWTQDASLIGSNPGVGFRPMPDQDKNSESTLIWYRSQDSADSAFWSDQLTEFLEKSKVPEGAENVIECSLGSLGSGEKRVCKVPTEGLGECTAENNFGYPAGKPCVLIKLNKIIEWQPEPFGIDENRYSAELLERELEEKVNEEPKGMPPSLKEHILSEVRKNPGKEVEVLRAVWLSCAGENVGDEENLPEGNISYQPLRQIPGYFFPYRNQQNYKSPFVMVQLDVPATSRHTLINVECRAWAKNIKYDRIDRLGSVHFEILVD